jgi:hypothetical protein
MATTYYNNTGGPTTTRGARADVAGPKQVRALVGPTDLFIPGRFVGNFSTPTITEFSAPGMVSIELLDDPTTIDIVLSEKYTTMLFAEAHSDSAGSLIVSHTSGTDTITITRTASGVVASGVESLNILLVMRK